MGQYICCNNQYPAIVRIFAVCAKAGGAWNEDILSSRFKKARLGKDANVHLVSRQTGIQAPYFARGPKSPNIDGKYTESVWD